MKHIHATIPFPALATLLLLLLLTTTHRATAAEKNDSSKNAPPPAMQVLVAYYSLHGNTEQFAQGVAEGAKQVPGTTVTIKKVEDVTKEDLRAADAIALGAPTYFANIPGKMKVVIDDWNWKWKVDFTDKVGGAFSTGGGQTAGKEFVVVSLLLFMINNRMVVAGPLYQDAEGEDIWGEAGASAMTGPLDPGVSDQELDAARRLGHRLATVAGKLQARQ
jgi:NAD(P)H dehydrogenase (quinone)